MCCTHKTHAVLLQVYYENKAFKPCFWITLHLSGKEFDRNNAENCEKCCGQQKIVKVLNKVVKIVKIWTAAVTIFYFHTFFVHLALFIVAILDTVKV